MGAVNSVGQGLASTYVSFSFPGRMPSPTTRRRTNSMGFPWLPPRAARQANLLAVSPLRAGQKGVREGYMALRDAECQPPQPRTVFGSLAEYFSPGFTATSARHKHFLRMYPLGPDAGKPLHG